MKKNKAYSLVELSVVLIIIGIMISGIIGSRALVDSSRIANSKSITKASVVPNIFGLIAWYETSSSDSLLDSQRTDGTKVTAWYDINPISIPVRKNTLVTNTGSVTYLKNGVGNLPSLKFSSASDASFSDLLLSSFDKGKSDSNTIFVVFQQQTRTSTGNVIRNIISNPVPGTNGVVQIGYKDNGSSDTVTMTAETATQDSSTSSNVPNFADNSSYIVSYYYDRGYSKGYVNNASTSAGNGYLSGSPGNNSLIGLVVGSGGANSTRFVGLISEIIIYDRPLKSRERIDVFSYLSKKYNITVSGT